MTVRPPHSDLDTVGGVALGSARHASWLGVGNARNGALRVTARHRSLYDNVFVNAYGGNVNAMDVRRMCFMISHATMPRHI
eukprot:8499683-Pyramimonas_sp.AAC.1